MTFSLSVSSGSTPNYNIFATGEIGLDQNQVSIGPPSLLPSPGNPATNVAQATPSADPLPPTIVTFTAVEEGTGQSSAANVTVSVSPSFSVNSSPSRTTFATSNEGIFGAVYDPFRKLVFAAAQNINSVLAFSSTDGHLVASIPVPQPYSIDETMDGSSVYVGSNSHFMYRIDPNLMQVVQQIAGPPPLTLDGLMFPQTVTTLSNGKLLFLTSDGDDNNDHVMLFDPSTQTWTSLDNLVPFASDYELRRSYDHSTVVIVTGSVSATVYDVNSGTFSPPTPSQSSAPTSVAVSPNGSLIAIYLQHAVSYYDHNLQLQNTFTELGGVSSMTFSRDGQSLYVAESNASSIISVRNASDYSLRGNVANLGDTLGPSPTIFDCDETGMAFEGVFQGGQGLGFVDTTNPGVVTVPIPIFRGNQTMIPETGLLNTPGATTVNGAGFVSGAQVFFGPPPASTQARPGTNVSVPSVNVIQVSPPSGTSTGPVNVTVVEPGGDLLLEPQAYTYGPQVGFIFPNAGPAGGGATSTLTGFGLGSPDGPTQIKVGGAAATNITTTIGGGALFGPFNMGNFEVSTPSGSPGLADVAVTLPEGGTVIKNGYQYLSEAKVFAVNGALGQIIYDRPRQRLYATNFSNNRVEVFSLQSETFGTPIPVGKRPEGLALTPDGTMLAVANSGDGTVSIIDPTQSTVLATVSTISPAKLDPNGVCGAELLGVTAIIPHRMILEFVCAGDNALDPDGTVLLNLDNESLDCTGFPTCNTSLGELLPMPEEIGVVKFFTSTTDGTKAVVVGTLIGLYDMSANTYESSSGENGGGGTQFFDLAIDNDANVILNSFGIFNANLQSIGAVSDYFFLGTAGHLFGNMECSMLNPSGSLYYVPTGTGADIFDVHRGRLVLRVSSPEAIPGAYGTLAIDETGSKMFLISNSGITILQLSQVPLSIGSITPSTGSVSGGTPLTIRGSGFVTGATVTFGTTIVPATFVDASTLHVTAPPLPAGSVRITITNPDGQSYQLDAAYIAQ
jgi:YVTN family beta-propeller protein